VVGRRARRRPEGRRLHRQLPPEEPCRLKLYQRRQPSCYLELFPAGAVRIRTRVQVIDRSYT
jgi:hypothetical protein